MIMPATKPRAKKGGPITSPFSIVVDTREQRSYDFKNIRANADKGGGPIVVPTERGTLHTGDYSIVGMTDRIALERKSKSDLYGSVAKRANFVGRLERMEVFDYAAVIVECEMRDCQLFPPSHSKLNPKSLGRTILAWRQRYKCDWWFLPDREWAEAYTYRILERFWLDHQPESACDQTPTRPAVSSST